MALNHLLVLLTIAAAEVMVVSGDTRSQVSRQKRSDDGGPLEAVVEHLSQQVTFLNAQQTTMSTKIAALEAKTSAMDRMVAFYVWNDVNPLRALAHGTLIFSHVATNIGNGYDRDTGIFTAPLSGLYDFQASIMGHDNGASVRAGIYMDSHIVAMALSDGTHGNNYDQATMKAIVHVTAGSKVAVKNTYDSDGDYYVGTDYPSTTFSGFLIKAD